MPTPRRRPAPTGTTRGAKPTPTGGTPPPDTGSQIKGAAAAAQQAGQQAKRRRRSPKPTVASLCKLIKEGVYDDEMGQLQGAINDRNMVRREAVNALVREVYGDNFVVAAPGSNNPRPPVSPGPGVEAPGLVSGGASAALGRGEAPTEELGGIVIDPTDPLGPDDVHPEDESRSPQLS